MFVALTQEHIKSFSTSSLLDISAKKLFWLSTKRNAYYGAKSHRYAGTRSLYLSLEEARKAAHEQRNKGTHFQIKELPGLVLVSEKGVVFCSELKHTMTLSTLRVDLMKEFMRVGTPLSEVIARIDGTNRIIWPDMYFDWDLLILGVGDLFLLDKMHDVIQDELLQLWDSQSSGGNYPLSWYLNNKPKGWGNSVLDAVELFIAINSDDVRSSAKNLIGAKTAFDRSMIVFNLERALRELEESLEDDDDGSDDLQ